jgi:hypothetical protein
MPWPWAKPTTRSAAVQLKVFCAGSVASHFISFSGVAMPNSRAAMVVYAVSPSLPALIAVPK